MAYKAMRRAVFTAKRTKYTCSWRQSIIM